MVLRRNKFPENGEIIIGTIKTVNPYSAFVRLDEYPAEGMVHVSEVARKWVRDIRTFVKENDKVVAVVMDKDEAKGHLSLSIKRVSDSDRNRRLQEWKRDQKGEKLLEKLAAKKGIKLEEVYARVGFDLQDSFRDMLEAFEAALKEPALLERKGLAKEWVDVLVDVARENIELKEQEMKGILEIRSTAPDAIDVIRDALVTAEKAHGVSVRYISAPKYEMSFMTSDLKRGDRVLAAAAVDIERAVKKGHGECSFTRGE